VFDRALPLYEKVDRGHPDQAPVLRALAVLYGLANRVKQQAEVRNRLKKLGGGA
jgi:hypothetical protein